MSGVRRGKKGNRGRKSVNPVDANLVQMARATGSNTNVVRDDLTERRQNFNLVQTPPKNFMSQIHWVRQSVLQPSAYSTSATLVNEVNFGFILNAIQNVSAYTTVFDQYCIYSATVTFTYGQSAQQLPIQMFTAIDYDNVANTGLSGISAFSSCNESIIVPGSSLVRFVKPCVALSAYTGAFTGFTTGRTWIDCNSTTVVHYGIRSVAAPTTSIVTYSVDYSLVIGFRNAHG